MYFLWYLLIGLVAGWLAGLIVKGRGAGFLVNLAVGVIGGLLGGWLFSLPGLVAVGTLGSLLTSLAGAVGSSRSSHPAAAKSAPTADTPAPALPANPPPAVSPLRRTARAEPTEGPPHRERSAWHGLPRKRSRPKPPRPESESREPLKTTAQSLPVPSAKADLRKRRKPAAEQRVFRLVELPGFEPGISEPKSDVLPLHHSSIRARKRRQRYAKNGKIQF